MSTADLASLRGTYLKRLERIVRLRQRHHEELNPEGLRLLDHSIFAAFCDCRDAGAGHEARQVLQDARFPFDSSDGLGTARAENGLDHGYPRSGQRADQRPALEEQR